MSRLTVAVGVLLVCVTELGAGDKPAPGPQDAPDRDRQLKAIRAEFEAAREDLFKAARAGKVKVQDGTIAELGELQKRTAKRTRELIDAEPKDEVALDAILFSVQALIADTSDPGLLDLLTKHHLASPKLVSMMSNPRLGEPFLRTAATKSPHAEVRGGASLRLANRLAGGDGLREAETLCEQILKDQKLTALHRGAADLLFEIRHLQVGKVVPELEGWDLEDKPMKLSEYRGKAVMLVFWATWCGPCMKMLPHERELAERYTGRPFALVGVNGDGDDGIKKVIEQKLTTWRSFKDYLRKEKRQISHHWNVHGWPAIFLIDHEGVIRHIFRGVPEEKDLDAAVEKLVTAAEPRKPDKK